MPEMHLRQTVFTYGASWSFTKKKKKKEYRKLKKQEIQDMFIKMFILLSTWLGSWRFEEFVRISNRRP